MAKDLAIDVGIPVDTDEFHTFVACVDNILTHGCEYGEKMTDHIVGKCHTSALPIAKKVLRECRRRKTSRHSKWWETYYHNTDVPRWPGRKPGKRPMSPMFDNKRRKRPMSPLFNKRKQPMSPLFNKKRGHRDDRRNDDYQNDRRNDDYRNDRRNQRQYGNYRDDSPSYERNSKKRKYR